ncbi:translesion error-prone DNA polymerase V autoproteolytic subunit [Endozoicomonas gorgoniicola]|uniref:Translesion error-prone DNA polymerase V autoproteolytic subunit n=1 Tax=Endozoicomonas gorgoniicola TaxID=1234144 RepID=A0ABT3MU02_9GAMM|nr:translesion error-prone DNA polymerase V autoproteolytic subunit [Endozoicomonas gorgoniicola]MCW7552870.1 translesion error-prone DNA polymerase V autoproteolytic subunit [Endozoicomonas gorgoniicola]
MIITPKLLQPPSGKTSFPFYQSPAACGFPSPAADYLEDRLSLDQLLVQHPTATFFARAQGNSMIGAGIHDGDLLIIDRSLTARSGDIVIALLDGELLVKRLKLNNKKAELHSEHPDYPPVRLTAEQELDVWGVVTQVIHELRS